MSRFRHLRARGSEDGFTLPELLMAITILGLIVAPIAAAFFVALRTVDETANRRRSSNDAQLLSVYLPPDVQSADDAVLSGFTSSTCSGVSASSIRLQLKSTVQDANFNVVYYTRQVGSGPDATYQLVRKTCAGTAQTNVIGRNLASLTAVTVTRTPSSGTLQRLNLRIREAGTTTDPTQAEFNVTASRRTT
jgi:prepilin-type N-terminal cleavage/methylation domain-containing protein